MLKRSVILITMLGMGSGVHAAGYAGIGIGQAFVDVETIDFGPTVSADVTDRDTSFKLFGGYTVTENISIEAGYVNFGEFGVHYSDGIDTLTTKVEGNALYVAAVGSIPFSQVSFFGKFGFAQWNSDASLTSTFFAPESISESGTDPMIGLGIKFDASDSVAISAELERYKNFGDKDTTGESDIDVFSVSAMMKF